MPDLEQRLRDVGVAAAWPPTPDLATAVAARLAGDALARQDRGAASRWSRRRRCVVAALVAVLLLTPAAALALPGVRDDILRTLGLRHVTVRRAPAPPRPIVDPQLGVRTTLPAAGRALGFTPLVPAALGAPDSVHRRGDVVTLVYARRGILVAQARGSLQPELLTKVIGVGEGVVRVHVDGHPGAFFPRRHFYLWLDRRGAFRQSTPVRSGPSLVWERDGVVLRLEGERRRAAALRLAASAR
jgi:hypothetical protein